MAINVSIVLLLAVIVQVLLKHEPLRAEDFFGQKVMATHPARSGAFAGA